jgi:hypothetical protein
LNDASIFGYETVWAETEMEIASATHTPVTLEMALREFLNLENIEHRSKPGPVPPFDVGSSIPPGRAALSSTRR